MSESPSVRAIIEYLEKPGKQLDAVADDLKVWTWAAGEPPRDQIIELIHEYNQRVHRHQINQKYKPSEERKQAQKLKRDAEKLRKNLPSLLVASDFFSDTWAAANSSDEIETTQIDRLALFEIQHQQLVSALSNLISACDLILKKLPTSDPGKNIRMHNTWLASELARVFREHVELREGDRMSEESAAFVELIGRTIGASLPSSPRAQRPSRTKLSEN